MRAPPTAPETNADDALPSERVLPLVYDELRRLAAARLRAEAVSHTLQPTALVHEAWLRLAGRGNGMWKDRAHFFGAAARAMRCILVDHARRKQAQKRDAGGAEWLLVPEPGLPGEHVLMIHAKLKLLEQEDPEAAEIVLLKFFAGLEMQEIAELLGRSVRSVERRWTMARARLYQMIRDEQ